jgi:hypothetical protein
VGVIFHRHRVVASWSRLFRASGCDAVASSYKSGAMEHIYTRMCTKCGFCGGNVPRRWSVAGSIRSSPPACSSSSALPPRKP